MGKLDILKRIDELKKKEEIYDAIIAKFGNEKNALDAIPEEDVLKFYYCESEDKYLVGQRAHTRYYAEIGKTGLCFRWSRYLPWSEHVVAPSTVWKEHTYPSEPKEIPFFEWLQGYIAQLKRDEEPIAACARWIKKGYCNEWECSKCKSQIELSDDTNAHQNFCPNCGSYMKP